MKATTETGVEPMIECPKCGTQIGITKALSNQAQEQVKRDLQAEWERQRKDQEAQFAAELRLAREKGAAEARDSAATELVDLRAALAAKDTQVAELRQTELGLRQRTRELDDRQAQIELDVARRLDEQRAEVEAAVSTRLAEQHRIADLSKDKQLADLRRQLEDANRRAQQGSQQVQGDALEVDLEQLLRREFQQDEIQPVQVGQRGGDVLQVVRDARGAAGLILWEVKNTKAFSDKWLPKLREDQREAGAAIAVLVTRAMPEEGMHFGQRGGVWVASPAAAAPLAIALRFGILEAARARVAGQNQADKQVALYEYLSGTEFKQRIEGILEPLLLLLTEHERDERVRQASAAKWEKVIKQAIASVARLYGDVSGVIGGVLPKIERLELPPAKEDKAA